MYCFIDTLCLTAGKERAPGQRMAAEFSIV
jgi:hypothetical protein